MEKVLRITAELVNIIHYLLIAVFDRLGMHLSDKSLHFWIIGIIGIFLFFAVDSVFKRIAKWNISVVSLIYTFTVLVVLVFGLEIEQRITGNGNMEFRDIVAGLWGFIVIFVIYAFIRAVYEIGIKSKNKNKSG